MNYVSLLDTISKAFNNPAFYWQLMAILICSILTFVFYKLTKYLLNIKIKNNQNLKKSLISNLIIKYLPPLLLPLLAMLTLSIGLSIFNEFQIKTFLFSPLIKLIGVFLFLRFIHVFFIDNYFANLTASFLSAILLLNIFGILEPTMKYLDSIAFSIGTVRISAYIIVKGTLILLLVFWLSGLISKKSKYYIQHNEKIKPHTKGIMGKIIDILIYIIVFIILLRVFGIDTTTFAVVGGAIAVGIGLGLQKIASNFIGGIILLFEKSVEIGDLVEIEGGIEGMITDFGGRYTLLETFDGKEIMVPNEDFIIKKVINLTYNNNRGRIEIDVKVAYDSDLDKVQEVMINIAKEHPRCLLYPSPDVFITKFGEYYISIVMHFWINNVNDGRMRPKSDVMIQIIKKFRENNITIPLPQRDLYFHGQSNTRTSDTDSN